MTEFKTWVRFLSAVLGQFEDEQAVTLQSSGGPCTIWVRSEDVDHALRRLRVHSAQPTDETKVAYRVFTRSDGYPYELVTPRRLVPKEVVE